MPDESYLKRLQNSADGIYYTQGSGKNNLPILDEDNHQIPDIDSEQESNGGDSMERDGFSDPFDQDLPVKEYLRKQDSEDDLFFDYIGIEKKNMLDDENEHNRMRSYEDSQSDDEFTEQDYTTQPYKITKQTLSQDGREFSTPDDEDTP
jgi:hypothetical protein